MSRFRFYEGKNPENFSVDYERFLFNEERHLESQSKQNWSTFSLIDDVENQIKAQVHFHIEDHVAASPLKAPFGSFQFSKRLNAENLSDFINEVEENLKKEGVKKIIIKNAPQIYQPEQSALLSISLLNRNYKIISAELSASIRVDETPLEDKISKDELYHLKRCRREKLTFRQIDLSNLDEVYFFLKKCRQERNTHLSLSLQQLQYTVQLCSTDFLLFGIYNNDELIAASIAVRISKNILYSFYYGNSLSSNALSPVVFLLDNQYHFCQANNFLFFDLGTSALNNQINFSLLHFKKEMGAELSMKFGFEKDLA